MVRAVQLVVSFILSAGPAAAGPPPPIELFARLPAIRDVVVAPGGQRFFAMAESGDGYALHLFSRDENGQPRLQFRFDDTDRYRFRWAKWVSDEQLVVSVRFASQRYGTATTETRLLVMNHDGSTIRPLFEIDRYAMPVQVQDRVVDLLPNDPGSLLLAYNVAEPTAPKVMRMSLRKRRRPRRVEGSRTGIQTWMTDTEHRVRAGWGVMSNGDGRMVLREAGTRRWRRFDHRVANGSPRFRILGFDPDPNVLWVASDHETDTLALYRFDIAEDRFLNQVFHHPTVDVGSLRYHADGTKPVGVSYVLDEPQVIWFDAEARAEVAALREATGGLNVQVTHTADGRYASVRASGEGEPGIWYLYDREARHLEEVGRDYPELQGDTLATVVATSYAARDGLEIPAFVTLPWGVDDVDEVDGVPFVVFPHGGPFARDFRRFDPWAQWFASRGWGVLQMNFRGSEGYGTAFKAAGNKQWGQAMQDDVTDGARWLVTQGWADRERLAIVGASYGGYVALTGAVSTPDVYACAVSVAGVTDLPDLIRHQQDYVHGTLSTRHIGALWSDRRMLAEHSPARLADQAGIPILLVHGEDDRRVPVEQGRKMAKALSKADKTVRYVELPSGDHHLSRASNRRAFFAEMDEFLTPCLRW